MSNKRDQRTRERAMAAYDPSPAEWVALLLFLALGALTAASFFGAAMAFQWRLWWRSLHRRERPPTQPQLFCTANSVAQLMVGVAMWLLWRKATRGVDGDLPLFFACMLVYLVYFLVSSAAGAALFCVGLQLGWIVAATAVAAASFGLLVALVVMLFVDGANAAGGVMVVPALWALYALVVAIALHRAVARRRHGVARTHDQTLRIDSQLERIHHTLHLASVGDDDIGGGDHRRGGRRGGYADVAFEDAPPPPSRGRHA